MQKLTEPPNYSAMTMLSTCMVVIPLHQIPTTMDDALKLPTRKLCQFLCMLQRPQTYLTPFCYPSSPAVLTLNKVSPEQTLLGPSAFWFTYSHLQQLPFLYQ